MTETGYKKVGRPRFQAFLEITPYFEFVTRISGKRIQSVYSVDKKEVAVVVRSTKNGRFRYSYYLREELARPSKSRGRKKSDV